MELTETLMRKALKALDSRLERNVLLIIGGGGAMILAHHFSRATSDIDGFSKGIELEELDRLVKEVARQLSISSDWLNPYFSTFAHTLPEDYKERLIDVYQGRFLTVRALGKEDLLVMKCFAHRQKDVLHSKALIKQGTNLKFVEDHLSHLQKKRIPGASEALEFLDDILDQI